MELEEETMNSWQQADGARSCSKSRGLQQKINLNGCFLGALGSNII
jgi:hypothetical protein